MRMTFELLPQAIPQAKNLLCEPSFSRLKLQFQSFDWHSFLMKVRNVNICNKYGYKFALLICIDSPIFLLKLLNKASPVADVNVF